MANAKAKAAAGGALALAIGLVAVFEGTKTQSYLDVGGIPTICTGHTGPEVAVGQTATADICRDLLAKDMAWAFAAEDKALDHPEQVPVWTRAAMASFIYNLGAGAWVSSPMPGLINLGKYEAACNAMLPYVNVRKDGKLVPVLGLIRRREAERHLCLGEPF